MNEYGIVKEENWKLTREKFKERFKSLNKECLGPEETILAKNPVYVKDGYYHNNKNCKAIRGSKDYEVYDITDEVYYSECIKCEKCYCENGEGCSNGDL